MRSGERKLVLRDGTACILRSPGPEDGEAVLRHIRRSAAESPYTAFLPEDVLGTLREEQAFLRRQLASPDRMMLGCFAEERLIGLGGVGPVSASGKCRHRGELAVTIRRRWWGLGLGRLLLEALCREAAGLGYEQLELEVMEDNARAVALYERCGFVTFGRLEDAYRAEGARRAVRLMVKRL